MMSENEMVTPFLMAILLVTSEVDFFASGCHELNGRTGRTMSPTAQWSM